MKRLRELRLIPLLVCAAFLTPLVAPPQVHATAIAITAGSFSPSKDAVYLAGKNYAGVAITAGQAVYIDTAVAVLSGQVKLASATGSGLATQVIGFAANGAGVGQPIKVIIRDPALVLGGTLAAGAVLFLHTTPGAVTSTYADLTTGGYVAVMGVGTGGNKANFGATKIGAAQFAGVVRADQPIP